MFYFNSFPLNSSKKIVAYICPKYKHKFDVQIKAVLPLKKKYKWNVLPISTPLYSICEKCKYDKYVSVDYIAQKVFHHMYKE